MSRKGCSILVVDDNQDIRDLITLIVEEEGYGVLAASDGESALNLLQIHQPELLLLDVMMPGLSGIDVLKEIRATGNVVPVLMITAKSQSMDIELALAAGANSYIVKPFRADALLEKISSLMSQELRK